MNTLILDLSTASNKSAASIAPCPTTALNQASAIALSKIKSKGRCISLSLNIINIDACRSVNFD